MQLLVARLGKPHGLRGEATAQVHTDVPAQRFVPGAQFVTEPASAGPLTLRSARLNKDVWLLAFEEATDRTAVEALRNTRLFAEVEREAHAASPDDDESGDGAAGGGAGQDRDVEEQPEDGWYEDELIGLAVVTVAGERVGEVSALHTRQTQDLLEVRRVGGGTALVPFVDEIVPEVDVEAGVITIDPPEGLLELGTQ